MVQLDFIATARLFAGVVLLTILGCDNRPARVAVSGKVLIDGQPLTWGFVQVIPQDSRASSGQIGPDGRFTMGCFEATDGCVPGKHAVAIHAGQPIGSTAIRWLAPKKYQDPTTSGLSVEIAEPTEALVIDITWGGGKPFTERFDGAEDSPDSGPRTPAN